MNNCPLQVSLCTNSVYGATSSSASSYISCIQFLLVPLDDSVQHLVGVGEHTVGEEEGGGVVRAGRVGDEQREQRGNRIDLMAWSAGRNRQKYKIKFYTTIHTSWYLTTCLGMLCVHVHV